MSYVSARLLAMAVEGLRGADPLAVISIPALTQAAATPTVAVAGVPFGGRQEKSLLDAYFRVGGAPEPEKPYRAVWNQANKAWVAERFAETSLQRQRRDRALAGLGFVQTDAPPNSGSTHNWAIQSNAAAQLHFEVVRLIDLAIWFGRERPTESLQQLLEWFQDEFGLKRDPAWDLVPNMYVDAIPPEYAAEPLSQAPIENQDLAQILGTNPPAVVITDTLPDLCVELEHRIRQLKFEVPPGIVETILRAWLRGDIVVLMGQPGTGKTAFSRYLTDALSDHLAIPGAMTVPVDDEFDASALLGYENLRGEPVFREFAERVLLSDAPLDPILVIFEEFNLTTIESYLSSILIALQEPSRLVSLPGGGSAALPRDLFIIATCNSYLDEASRSRLSFPTKRRSCVIEMPNMLFERYTGEGPESIGRLAIDRIASEKADLQNRIGRGGGSAFDQIRLQALSGVSSLTDIHPDTVRYLQTIVETVLTSPEGAAFMTLGLLKDIALDIAYAPRNREAELAALLSSVSTKLIPQLRGPHARADELLQSLQGIGDLQHLDAVLSRMKSYSPDQLTTPL
jgi:MoxR-like ATPase